MKSIKSIKFITKSLRSITIFIALYKIQLKKKKRFVEKAKRQIPIPMNIHNKYNFG